MIDLFLQQFGSPMWSRYRLRYLAYQFMRLHHAEVVDATRLEF